MNQLITLIGMMGSGKSTIGPLLAKQLSVAFADTDTLIEQAEGLPIADIFHRHGEAVFRQSEKLILQNAIQKFADSGGVLATGGGIVLNPQNRALLQENGACVYLYSNMQTIMTRVAGTEMSRPLLKDTTQMSALLNERDALYRETAHIVIAQNPNKKPAAVVSEIMQALPV